MGEINNQRIGRSFAWILPVLFAIGLSAAGGQSFKHSGRWHNTTFGSFGDITLYAERADGTVTFSIDADGFVFGSAADTPPLRLNGPTDGGGGTTLAILGHPTFGDVDGSFVPTGPVSGDLIIDMVNVPSPSIRSLRITGTMDLLSTELSYRIEFDTPTPEPQRVEGADFALGTIEARFDAGPMFDWIYPRDAGDAFSDLVVAGGTAVAVGGTPIARRGDVFEEINLPAEVRVRTFLGVANDGTEWAALDSRGQTFRSADGISWTEGGVLPDAISYSDVAADVVNGRFVFAGSDGRIDSFVLGENDDLLVPASSWTAPDGMGFSRAKKIGATVYVGGTAGRLAVWDGSGATLETIAGAGEVSDVAMGGGNLVAATIASPGTAGAVYRRPAAGGAWADAGLGMEFNTVDYNFGEDRFLFCALNGRYGVTPGDLTPPDFFSFSSHSFTRVAAAGDQFYVVGGEGVFAQVPADAFLVDLRDRPFDWPFYHMTRAADRLLMLSRFGRVFHSTNNGIDFFEQRIFSGFTSPSPRTSVTLADGRVLILCDEAAGPAVGSDGVTWQTTRDIKNTDGTSVFPQFIDSAISDTGLIAGLGRSNFGSAIWLSNSEPDIFDLGGNTFDRYNAIIFAAGHFLRFSSDDLRIDRSTDGASWTVVQDLNGGGALTAAFYDEEGGFALAGAADGRIFRAAPDFSTWVEVFSPFSSPLASFCYAGEGQVLALGEDGEVALSKGGDFQIVEAHSGPFLDLHWDETSKSVFALGESGKLMRYQTEAVAAPPTVWEAWQISHFTEAQIADPTISGPDADPEQDGNSNLVEFLTGGDPLSHDQRFVLRPFQDVDQIGPYVGLDARVPLGMEQYFTFDLETSTDGAWFTWGSLFPFEDAGTLRVLYTMDLPQNGFMARLRIQPKPELGLP